MNIKAEYSREDVDALVLAEHLQTFGPAPDGDEWVCSGSYGERVVRNVEKKPDDPEVVIEPPKPEEPAAPDTVSDSPAVEPF